MDAMSAPEMSLPDVVIELDKMLDKLRGDAHWRPGQPSDEERRNVAIATLDGAGFYLRSMSTKLASP